MNVIEDEGRLKTVYGALEVPSEARYPTVPDSNDVNVILGFTPY